MTSADQQKTVQHATHQPTFFCKHLFDISVKVFFAVTIYRVI
jgi:hypothetical protein